MYIAHSALNVKSATLIMKRYSFHTRIIEETKKFRIALLLYEIFLMYVCHKKLLCFIILDLVKTRDLCHTFLKWRLFLK